MTSVERILQAFDNLRRAQRAGVYAPHKPLLILLALGRVQRGEPRQIEFSVIDAELQALLAEFGPSGSSKSRHYPFWHLSTDGGGALWQLSGPDWLLARPAGATPSLGELRSPGVRGGFPADVHEALRGVPGLLEAVAVRVLDSSFPATLHDDIAATVGLTLDAFPMHALESAISAADTPSVRRRSRDSGFRERVLLAYEYRCCVCGFDLRIGQRSAGLEAAHIQWHHTGGPDVESNGLALCALHHKLFDLGVFTVEPIEHRVVFSRQAIAANRGPSGELRHHGQLLLPAQQSEMRPGSDFLAWNLKNVFKTPARPMA